MIFRDQEAEYPITGGLQPAGDGWGWIVHALTVAGSF